MAVKKILKGRLQFFLDLLLVSSESPIFEEEAIYGISIPSTLDTLKEVGSVLIQVYKVFNDRLYNEEGSKTIT